MLWMKSRGKVIYKAKTEPKLIFIDSLFDRLLVFIGYAICAATLIYLTILDITGRVHSHSIGGMIIVYAIQIPLLFFFLYALYLWPLQTDVIYENGFTTVMEGSLINLIRGGWFHRFEDVKKIKIINRRIDNETIEKKVLIYESMSEKPSATVYDKIKNGESTMFADDYFDIFVKTLKEKCPNAKWEYQELCIKSPQSIVKRRGVVEGNNEDGVSSGAWTPAEAYAVVMFTTLLFLYFFSKSIGADIILFVFASIIFTVVVSLIFIHAYMQCQSEHNEDDV